MRYALIFFAALLAITSVSAEVVEITSENFDAIVKKEGLAFLEFFAPWCGHCQRAAPEFEKVSDMLKGMAIVGKVDCTKEMKICESAEVNGYPKFFIFKDGQKVAEYVGERLALRMFDFVKFYTLPDIKDIHTLEEFNKTLLQHPKVCLIKTYSVDSELRKIMNAVAPKFKSTFYFVLTTDPLISAEDDIESIVVYRQGDDKETLDTKATIESVTSFLEKASVLYIDSFTSDTASHYAKFVREKVGILFLDPEKHEEQIKEIRPAAKKYRNDVIFISVPLNTTEQVAKAVGLPDNVKYPAFVIASGSSVYFHPMDIPADANTIIDFVEKFLNNKVEPVKKSQPIPEEDTVNGLTTFVGKTLDSYIQKGKNMMIYLYAPWCGHCNNFTPIYEEFARAYRSNDLIIGKIDATANDFNQTLLNVKAFPTVYFIPAGSHESLLYNGERTVDGLMSFAKKHIKESSELKDADLADVDL